MKLKKILSSKTKKETIILFIQFKLNRAYNFIKSYIFLIKLYIYKKGILDQLTYIKLSFCNLSKPFQTELIPCYLAKSES
jgi:hypothetical protein